jgi:predicted TPR repeat methyltransferase
MLDKARERNLYARLEHLDLLSMMQREPAAIYDVVFAADVFVYIGKLDELAGEARRLLRPRGLFAFSVESLEALNDGAAAGADPHDYRLNVTGRYAHSIAYLSRMAAGSGFDVLSTTTTQSRLDKGRPVQGYLALWRCPGVAPDSP